MTSTTQIGIKKITAKEVAKFVTFKIQNKMEIFFIFKYAMLSGYIRHKMTVKLSFSLNKINVLLNRTNSLLLRCYWSLFSILNNCVRCNINCGEKYMCIPNGGYISGIYAVVLMMTIFWLYSTITR